MARKNTASRLSGTTPKRIKTGKGLERASPDAVLVLCLTQGNQPNCSLALANIACQSYCVNHATF
eukprot:scaffold179016_cov31-Attheya_sp.AAC.1